ncbi:MAG: YidC/Oxa1 family membrane protein insertase [bacterium]|nr:YidC/Oxa1 family membrane protein insertase [bacterium]
MKEFFKAILYTPLYNLLIFLVWLTPGNDVGVAIIVLTVLIRLALLPSTNKSYQAQKEMKAIQPKLEEIKKKYSKEEQAAKTMELYKEHKVNPLGSCLPLLIQLPIIFVLYSVFQVGLDTSHFNLLYSFIPRPSVVDTYFLGINLARPEKWFLPIIVGLLQLVQMWQMQRYIGNPTKSSGGQSDMVNMMTKQMMYFTPVMTFFISLRLPAALPLYWGVTTLFTIAQQWWFFEKKGLAIVGGESGGSFMGIKNETPTVTDAPAGQRFKTKSKDVVVTVRRKGER